MKTTKTLMRIAGRRGRDMNPGSPEYEAGVLNTRPRRSVGLDLRTYEMYVT
jgi:hypothetical protein